VIYYCDADDFHAGNTGLELLEHIKARIPGFKITLFTIPGLSSPAFLESVRRAYDWIDLCPHGRFHPTNYECLQWTADDARTYLLWLKWTFGDLFSKGFKAPGWQISNGCYEALEEHGYWCADQSYNDARRPPSLKAYPLDAPNKLHFHVQNTCGNGLEESMDRILALPRDVEFGFINDLMGAN
jgi:hypothetical protein